MRKANIEELKPDTVLTFSETILNRHSKYDKIRHRAIV